MNKAIRIHLSLLVTMFAFSTLISTVAKAQTADDSTASGEIDDQTITENIKKRLEKVSGKIDDIVTEKKKLALIGTLESIANSTLTITGDSDISLASVSAETAFIRNPGNDDIDLDEVAIGDFIIAMGYLNGSEVLEARRVIVSNEQPEPTTKKSAIGRIADLNLDDDELILTQPDGSTLTLSIDDDTDIKQDTNGVQEIIDSQDLQADQQLIVVYQPDEDEEESNNTVLLLVVIPSQLANRDSLPPEASDSADIEE